MNKQAMRERRYFRNFCPTCKSEVRWVKGWYECDNCGLLKEYPLVELYSVREGEKCVWTRCDDWDYSELWSTSCGQEFNLKDGYTPTSNGMKYCCFCGKSLEEE